MCGFRPSASTLATWLSAYYFSASYCEEELHPRSVGSYVPTALRYSDPRIMYFENGLLPLHVVLHVQRRPAGGTTG